MNPKRDLRSRAPAANKVQEGKNLSRPMQPPFSALRASRSDDAQGPSHRADPPKPGQPTHGAPQKPWIRSCLPGKLPQQRGGWPPEVLSVHATLCAAPCDTIEV